MKHLLLSLFILVCTQCPAQLPDYYVYLVSGEVTITKPGAGPVVAKQKDLVFKNDVLTVKKGTSVTLVDKDASFLTLSTPLSCRGSDIFKKAAKRTNDGMTGKYLQLLYRELLDPSHDFEKFKKENIAGIRGGVSRGDEYNNRLFPVNGLKTSKMSLSFRWHSTSPSSDYSLFIYDGQGTELLHAKTKDTSMVVDLMEKFQGTPAKYFWRVRSPDGEGEDEIPIYFDLLTTENEKKQAAAVGGIGSNDIETQLKGIDKLEKNAFIDMALSRYASLVKENAANKALLKSYVALLLKYGFDEEAKSAWNY